MQSASALMQLEEAFEWERVPYIQQVALIHDFCSTVLVLDKFWLQVDETLKLQFEHALICMQQYLTDKRSAEQFAAARITVWQQHDAYPASSIERKLLRLMVCGLYDEQTAQFDDYGWTEMLDLNLSCVEDLHPYLRLVFLEFVLCYPALQAYKKT